MHFQICLVGMATATSKVNLIAYSEEYKLYHLENTHEAVQSVLNGWVLHLIDERRQRRVRAKWLEREMESKLGQ